MATDKELKPKSFRIDEETSEKFKQISVEIGGNQQEALSKLIESFEFQKGKAVLTNKKEDIDTFEKYVTSITRMYMTSLEDNQNLTLTVRSEFEALLLSKDSSIQKLQGELIVSEETEQSAINKAKTLTEENFNINNKLSSLEKELEDSKNNYENILSDKNSLNRALTDSCNDLKSKVEDMQTEYKELKVKVSSLNKTISERDTLKAEANFHIKTIADLKQHEADSIERVEQQSKFNLDKSLLELEKKYQEQIQAIKEDEQKKIDQYQQKYFDLLKEKSEEK